MPLTTQRLSSNIKFLVPTALAALGWLLTFIGLCIIQSKTDDFGFSGMNPRSAQWYHLFFWFFVLLGIVGAIMSGNLEHYRIALVALLAISFVYVTGDLEWALRAKESGGLERSLRDGVGLFASGLFFLSFAFLPWLILLGSAENAFVNTLGTNDSSFNIPAAMNHLRNRNQNSQQHRQNVNSIKGGPQADFTEGYNLGSTAAGPAVPPQEYARNSVIQAPPPAAGFSSPSVPGFSQATALFSYEANAEDPSEVSFVKGDKLEILNKQGKWWQVRKADGSLGIAPSNYLQLDE